MIVETSVFIRAYPVNRMTASSLIFDYLNEHGYRDIIERYSLEPFELQVQDLRRTFIDKLFAVGDYYLAGKNREALRGEYDGMEPMAWMP